MNNIDSNLIGEIGRATGKNANEINQILQNPEAMKQMRKMIKNAGLGTDGNITNKSEKIGRNDPCPCKSGKKYKKCCNN